jgi:D-xylose transport system ATP-binding protein
VADTIVVLRLGQDVARFTTAATNQSAVVQAITAGELTKVPGQQEEALA